MVVAKGMHPVIFYQNRVLTAILHPGRAAFPFNKY